MAHDTLVRCRQQWRRVAAADRSGAYAHRIAINLANSWFRRRSAERRAMQRAAGGHPEGRDDPCSADAVAVRRAVASLPARQREVVVRRFYLDEDVTTVAAAMGVTASSVRSATTRAIAALRRDFDIAIGSSEEVCDVSRPD